MRHTQDIEGLLERTQRTVFFRATLAPIRSVDYVSPAIASLLGYPPEAFHDDIDVVFDMVVPADRSKVEHFFLDPSSCPTPLALRFRHRDGHVVCLEYDYHVFHDGDTVTVEGLAQDVTARRAKEDELERLSHELEQAKVETLHRLALAAEYRDDATHQHTQRVAETCALICTRLGLAPSDTETIKLAAPLHDIGKIGIPDRILLKPGPLTDAEYAEMKNHTTIGAAILEGSYSEILDVGADIALGHHERWDGAGYPSGIKGTGVPLAARILAVADVLDALTHDRPYKDAWPLDRALEEIRSGRGSQFDPDVVDAVLGAERRSTGPALIDLTRPSLSPN